MVYKSDWEEDEWIGLVITIQFGWAGLGLAGLGGEVILHFEHMHTTVYCCTATQLISM